MDNYNIQVLFLHNITPENEDVIRQNFESFKHHNTDIIGLCDGDLEGLENSVYVPIKSFIPRGNRRWSPENVILNYVLINYKNLNHSHYMFCEYDCYTDCNINELCKPYKDYDVVVPNIVRYEDEKNWQWFKSIENKAHKDKLIGFRPSVFILFKKEALIKLALIYRQFWEKIQNLNSEVRLGVISKYANFNICEFENLKININWFETKFTKNNKIYHPVKRILTNDMFFDLPKININSNKIGEWYFGRLGDKDFFGKVYLNSDGTISQYNNFNEKFWKEEDDKLLFYNGKGGITTIFSKFNENIYHGDYYNGEIFDNLELLKKSAHVLVKVKN